MGLMTVRETEQTRRLRSRALWLARHRPTEYVRSDFGCRLQYRDARLRVMAHLTMASVDVEIWLDDAWTVVFSAVYHSPPAIYRPGHWETYLAHLHDRLRWTDPEVVDGQPRGLAASESLRYAPVDDGGVFGD